MLSIYMLLTFAIALASNTNLIAGIDMGYDTLSFNIEPYNLPTSNFNNQNYTIKTVNYYNLNSSTWSFENKTTSGALRFNIFGGTEINILDKIKTRFLLTANLAGRSWTDTQILFYNPVLNASNNVSEDINSIPITNILPNSNELIQLTQKPSYGLTISPLWQASNRTSMGPIYSYYRAHVQSNELLSGSTNIQKQYASNIYFNQHVLGVIWHYKLNHETAIFLSFQKSKNDSLAKKELYFVKHDNIVTARLKAESATSTDSNWNGISCQDKKCTCKGSDCSLNQYQPYDIAPYLNLSQNTSRISTGIDFYLNSY